MNFSIKELKKICSKKQEDFIMYYFYRNISVIFTRLFINTRITANQVTFLSFFIALISAVFFILGEYKYLVIGALLYNLSFVFDLVDGELVRYRNYLSKKEKESYTQLGIWLDTTFDILGTTFVFVALTIGLYSYTGDVNTLIIGFLATINLLIMYTFIIRKYTVIKETVIKEHREFRFGGKYYIASGCAISVLLILAALLNKIYYFLLFWAIIGFFIWIKQFFSNYKLFKKLG